MGSTRRHLTIQDLVAHAKTLGGQLLSSKYSGVRAEYRWECDKGHKWKAHGGLVLAGSWCPNCLRHSRLEKLQKVATLRGGRCLSKTYVNSHSHLLWECSKGHKWKAKPNNISNGTWCKECSKVHVNDKRRRTIHDLKKHALSKGGICISDELPTATSKVRWRCARDHEWDASPQSVMGAGNWCQKCGNERHLAAIKALRPQKLDELKRVARERGGACLSNVYVRQLSHLRWRCSNGHEWLARPSEILKGGWCPECSARLGERICRVYFEQLYGKPFPKCKPSWLRSPSGTLLELDGYSSELKLAFEHHGAYHYQVVPPYSANKAALAKRQRIDALKKQLCNKYGVAVIEIPEVPTMTSLVRLRDYVISEAKKVGRPVPGSRRKIEIDISRAYQPETAYRTIAEDAVNRGGRLVSPLFLGWSIPLTWQCGAGHTWPASPGSVYQQKTWCPECAGVKRKTIAEMREIARKRGGDCISEEYLGAATPIMWRCGSGHEWPASPTSIISRKSWCPQCAGQRGHHTSIEYMREIAKKRGGECLSSSYKNTKTKLLWRCAKGHEWPAIPLNVIHKGSWCPTCGNALKGPRKAAA